MLLQVIAVMGEFEKCKPIYIYDSLTQKLQATPEKALGTGVCWLNSDEHTIIKIKQNQVILIQLLLIGLFICITEALY